MLVKCRAIVEAKSELSLLKSEYEKEREREKERFNKKRHIQQKRGKKKTNRIPNSTSQAGM
jgi:hypothetical protein